MRVLIAPNSMKGSLNAFQFADIVERAFEDTSVEFENRKVPVADGGDFTGEILKRSLKAKDVLLRVQGPLLNTVDSKYSISGETAIIEMADASGMKLVNPKELDPMKASSFGTGELIKDAISRGCKRILLAIGGSATVDGGMGMMEALGFQFFDDNGNVLRGNGINLAKIHKIEKLPIANDISIEIICDVDNPLLGEKGAAQIFSPQKGATQEMVEKLEKGLKNLDFIIKKETGVSIADEKGAGAAGGISVPLMAFWGAKIVPGAQFVLNELNFDSHVQWADLVITGEGRLDSQTLNNKAPFVVAKAAQRNNKPVLAIGGSVEKEAAMPFDGIYSIINKPMTLEYAIENASRLLYEFSLELAGTLLKMNLTKNEG